MVKEVTAVWCLFPQGKSLSEGSTLAISDKLITFQSSHPHTIILEVKTLMPTFGEAQMFSITVCFSGILLGLFCSPWKFWILTIYMAEPGGNTGEQWQTREQFEMSPWLGRKIPLNPVCPFPSLLFFLFPLQSLMRSLSAPSCEDLPMEEQRGRSEYFPLLLLSSCSYSGGDAILRGFSSSRDTTWGHYSVSLLAGFLQVSLTYSPLQLRVSVPSPLFRVPWTLPKTL